MLGTQPESQETSAESGGNGMVMEFSLRVAGSRVCCKLGGSDETLNSELLEVSLQMNGFQSFRLSRDAPHHLHHVPTAKPAPLHSGKPMPISCQRRPTCVRP